MERFFEIVLFLLLHNALLLQSSKVSDFGQSSEKLLFNLNTPCTYSYQVSVHIVRGSKSTASQGYELHSLVDVIPVSFNGDQNKLHTIQLKVYQPRIRRLRGHNVLVNHPVNEELEKKLSNPFYFRQHDHGTVVDAFFPYKDDHHAIALKKGIAGAFQVNLKTVRYKKILPVTEEHDDSGVYYTTYQILLNNDTHTTVKREWTNNDYLEFADGRPAHGEQKIESQHLGIVHVRKNQIYKVHRTHKAAFSSKKRNPRAENKNLYQEQDIQISTTGYNKLTLVRCDDVSGMETPRHRSRRSAPTPENLEKDMQELHRENLVFKDSHKINWEDVGGEKIKFRPFYELMRCFTDPTVKNNEIGECTREIFKLVKHDKTLYKKICNMVLQRNHQNVTSWSVLVSAIAGRGGHHSQSVLAQALMSEYPRRLTSDEYETLLEGIFHIPNGPIHKELFDGLFTQASRDSNHGHKSPMAMLVLSGLTKRAEIAGYNSTLSDVVAEFIRNSYHNKSNVHDPESVEHESYVRDHIWAFGNLGHLSGLEILLKHADHDSSAIRAAVVSSMRKLHGKDTKQILLDILYKNEMNDVKAAVIDVFVERHEDLTNEIVQALEHAIWNAEDGDELDAAVQTFLENHHSHPRINHIRKKRRILRRRKRALISFRKTREFELGPKRKWLKNYGGKWLGAETIIHFINQVKFQLGIFGGKFEIDIDNKADFNAHIFSWKFDIMKGKASFKATATFKNDFPKDLIHFVADLGDEVLEIVDGVSNVFVEQLQNFINKLKKHLPINFLKLVDFFNAVVKVVDNLTKPLKPIQMIENILRLSKNIFDRDKKWHWMLNSMKEIQNLMGKLKNADGVFMEATTALDQITDIGNRISSGFPQKLHPKFKIEELLDWLSQIPLDSQETKLKEFFKSLQIPEPDGFKLQLPFKYAMHFPLSMDRFTKICMELVNFGNSFLDMSLRFEELQGIQFPYLILPQLERKFAMEQTKSFNFGLGFDWGKNLNFKVNVRENNFMRSVKTLGKLSEFFKQFHLHSFDLETFFENIMPGKHLDIGKAFPDELFSDQNSSTKNFGSPDDIFKRFVKNVLNMTDSSLPKVNAVSDVSDFFKELGPVLKHFAVKNLKSFCSVSEFTIKASSKLTHVINNIDGQAIATLKTVNETTQGTINEILNYTVQIDEFISEIKNKFRKVTEELFTKSISKLMKDLRRIKLLSDQFVQFANGTSTKVTGICTSALDLSAEIIDKVQNISRDAISELTKFIGPVAQEVKSIGQRLKNAVTDVEKWYTENLDQRVGTIAKVARLITDLMSIVNTRKEFLGIVREIAVRINDVLTNLKNLPIHAQNVRKTADDIIKFVDGSKSLKSEILKLDQKTQFGFDYDRKLREFCNSFFGVTASRIKISGYDIITELNGLFEREAKALVLAAGNKLKIIKDPLKKNKHKLEEISRMVSEIRNILVTVKPFNSTLLPVLSTVAKLPDCQQMSFLFTDSIKPCVKIAMIVGKGLVSRYKDMRKQIAILYDMIPETWKSLKMKNCIKGEKCLSKSFINQVKLIQKQTEAMKKLLEDANTYSDVLKMCATAVKNISVVINTIKDLIKEVNNFEKEDEVKTLKAIFQTFTGRGTSLKKTEKIELTKRVKRNADKETISVKHVNDYLNWAREVKTEITSSVGNTFQAMQNVYQENIKKYTEKVKDIRDKLSVFHGTLKTFNNIFPAIQSFEITVRQASDFTKTLKNVTSLFASDIQRLLTGSSELSGMIKPLVEKYVDMFKKTFDVLNQFSVKIQDFLDKIQLRQKGLDLSQYKEWSAYPYCSADVCVRSIRRSSSLYYSTIFPWKFSHLDDLSSMKDSGRWLIPGLFDDYKVQGIVQLSQSQIILAMHGVSVNNGKASILVITNPGSSVRKIIQLGSPQSPLTEKIGGISIARNSIWLSGGNKNKIYLINKGSVTGSMSSSAPSWIGISKSYNVEGIATSVSFDEAKTMLWVTDGNNGKGYGYRLTPDGDLLSSNLAPDRVLVIGKEAQGMAIVRQFNTEYAVISRCAMRVGFQCKLEFHDLSEGDEISEKSLSRVIRTPSGLESVEEVGNDMLTIVFSSGTYSEKNKIQLTGGDFEDRYFRIKLPILKTIFDVHENCLLLRVLGDWIISPRKLFSFGEFRCGKRRRRSVETYLLETDVYTEELEKIHSRRKRDTSKFPSCSKRSRVVLTRGYIQFGPEMGMVFPVYGIIIRLFAGARGYYSLEFEGQVCLKDKMAKLGIIPGASVGVYVGASVSLLIVEAGVTIEAILLDTRLIPELKVKLDKWPLEACLGLRMEMTPLKIHVYAWFRLHLCISVRAGILWIKVKIGWCRMVKISLWSWSTGMIKRTLFSSCRQNIDKTPPVKGVCEARQVGDKAYFVQWHGFQEDTSINHYWVNIGSIKGSGDDFGANVGTSLSTIARNLPIMHGREVYVSVRATNDMGMDSRLALCPLFKAKRRGPQIRYINDGSEVGQEKDYQSDGYGLGMNFAWAKGDQNILDVKWGISSSPKCTLDESEVDIYRLMPVGETNSIHTSGLSLKHGQKYYTRVVATNSIGLKTVMCSDGIVIDTTPPAAGYLFDGSGENDTDFITSTRRVRARFQSFTDKESPIVKYEWKITLDESAFDVTSFRSIPLSQRTPLMASLSLQHGQKYKIVLRGFNAVGLKAVVKSDGFIVDTTPPDCEYIFDVVNKSNNKDLDFARELNSIQGKWNCFDKESGIYEQLIAIGTYPGGADIQPFINSDTLNASVLEDGHMFVKIDLLEIDQNLRYHLTIKVFNGAGLRRTISSDGISIDRTPPVVNAYFIKDGLKGSDKSFTKEPFSFSVHWEQAFIDAESGLAEYRVGLGTKPGLTDSKNVISVLKRTNFTLTGLVLESGRKYFATVVGCNGVGMCVNASSNGMVVDFIPPHPGKVITGYQGPPALFQWITNSVWARWKWCPVDEKRNLGYFDYSQCTNDSFYDVHSGISGFGLSVASVGTESLLAEVKNVGQVRMSGRAIDLKDGVYSVVVEATDKAGMKSIGYSNIFTVDSTPPTIVTVQNGHLGKKLKYTNCTNFTFKSYFELKDNLSKIASYKLLVGSYMGAEDIVTLPRIELAEPQYTVAVNWTAEHSIKLKNNRKYYITVQAVNNAGLLGSGSSEALISDSEAPANVIVLDGWDMMDADYQSYSSIYRVHWQEVYDFSGVHSVYVGLKSRQSLTTCDVSPLERAQNKANYHVLSGLNLNSGSTYYACLKIVDNAQNSAYFVSDGMTIDNTPPSSGYVVDGNTGQDLDFQSENSVLWATWSNFTEEETEIVQYKLAFGTAPGKEDIQEFTDVGLVQTASSTRLSVAELKSGHRYYATVIAINKLDIQSERISSDGVLIDITPPFFIAPTTDGIILGQGANYSNENLSCSWLCIDQETKLQQVEVAFGLRPGSSDVKQFTSVPISSRQYEYQTTLKSGFKYFATVRCSNNVGLAKISISNGITYDNTPPHGFVEDGNYQNYTNRLKLSWKFVDAESGIFMYQVRLLNSDKLAQEGPFEFPGNINSASLILNSSLDVGKKYFTNLTAFNGAGLASYVISDGFVIDNTPPVCDKIWHGVKEYRSRLRIVAETSILYVSWNCSDHETPLIKLQFAVKVKNSSKFILPFHSLNENFNYIGSAAVTARRSTQPKYEKGKTYLIGLELTNAVELTSIFWTDGVQVDTTPPIFKDIALKFNPRNVSFTAFWDVKDDESGLDVVKWGLGSGPEKTDIINLTAIDVSIKSFALPIIRDLKLGLTCFFSMEAVNFVGLVNRAVSTGVVIDRTKPEAGIVTAQYVLPLNYDRNKNVVSGSSFTVSWTGFVDKESGISQYSWATGESLQSILNMDDSQYTNILLEESVGGVQIMNVTLVGNTTYYVCIRATNGAGLQRTDCSPGMKVLLGKFSAGVVNDGPRNSKRDLDFQLDDRALWAYWSGFEDPVYGVSSYEWCIGDHQPKPSDRNFCKWPYMKVPLLRNYAHRLYNLTLEHGTTYYATVKAINSRGESVQAISDGVVVDRSIPEGRSIKISPAVVGKSILYTTSVQAPILTWDMKDKESGISHFKIGAGSFPFQDDLMNFKKVDGFKRSVSMEDFNFTMSKGLKFFVTISGFNMLGLKNVLTSQQVIADWTPPVAGVVIDGDIMTGDRDYQTRSDVISAYWYGFEDDESDIVQYRWCIGLKQGPCTLTKMMSSGLLNYASVSLELQEGIHFFVTVEATNGAGFTQLSFSDGVTIDSSPPVISDISFATTSDEVNLAVIGNRTYQSSGRSLKAQWKKVTDTQSKIISLKYCIGKNNNACDVIKWTDLHSESTSILQTFEEPFPAGTTLYVTLEATNRAGLSAKLQSGVLVIDSTPPSIGRVLIGNKERVKYFKESQAIEAVAIGFQDKESGIKIYEWAICFAISIKKCINSFIDTGLNSTFTKDKHDFTPGVSYKLMVRVKNQVGLRSKAWSSTFTIENDYPIPKSVFDGSEANQDISIQSSIISLSANWRPFINPNSRITNYELCVGSRPSLCDVEPYQSVGLSLKGEISGLTLRHMNTYYITVRAWNEAGHEANASSNGVKIDSTPPVGGTIRDGIREEDIDYQADDSFISANWDPFTDSESGIKKYIWCAGTAKGSCDVIGENIIEETTRKVGQQLSLLINPGLKVYIKVTAINGGGAKTTSYSDGVTIDSSPPEISEVKDLPTRRYLKDVDFITSKVEYCVVWNAIDQESDILHSEILICPALTPESNCLISSMDVGMRTAICMSNLELLEGVKYVAKVRVTNKAGLSSSKASDGFVFDFSPPVTGEVYHVSTLSMMDTTVSRFTSSDIEVQWHGFWDKESSVSKHYICLESVAEKCDHINNYTDIGNRTKYSFKGNNLRHNTMYYASVIAENGAGLQSTPVSSVGVLMDLTAPTLGNVLHDGKIEGTVIQFQSSGTEIKAHFTNCEDPESDIVKVTWCVGTTSGLCNVLKMRDLSPWLYSIHSVFEKPVKNGQRLYVTVQATNGAGKTTTATSNGVTIDNTPPKQGKVFWGNSTNELHYLFGDDDIDAQWINFTDEESGIQSYEFAICDARNLAKCPQPYTPVNNATHVQITGLDFESGASYIAKVRATNFAGLETEATSKDITVDYSPPISSYAWLGPGSTHLFFQSSNTELQVRWQTFSDSESGIVSYEICITLSGCNISDYIHVGLNTSYALTGLELSHGNTYRVIVKGNNRVGLDVTTTTQPITIDNTPPKVVDPILTNETAKQPILRFNCTEEFGSCEWDTFGDPESGILKYEFCVGTKKELCDIVPLTSVATNLNSQAFIYTKVAGSSLFAKFKAFNKAGLYVSLESECVVETKAPTIDYIKDLEASRHMNDDTDIDWTASTTGLRFKWALPGNITGKSKIYTELAVTLPLYNESYPRIDKQKSWNGEPFVQNFMRVQPGENNLTIESLDLKPWEQYRGVIRVWNNGEIYNEISSDGVRVETNLPLPLKLVLQDTSPEIERLRWLPNIRLPIFNKSYLKPEIMYISSPSNIFLAASSSFNITNTTQISEAALFGDTKDFKVLITRVPESDSYNRTNRTTEDTLEMKTLPGVASPQGPCCANHTPDDVTIFSDNHYKPTLPAENFGSFVALLEQEYLAVASVDKVLIFSLQNKLLNREVIDIPGTISGISHFESYILIMSKKEIYVYNLTFAGNASGASLHTEKMPVISDCKFYLCNASQSTWSNFDVKFAVIHNDTMAVAWKISANASVVGIFNQTNGVWQVKKVLGESENNKNFGKALAMNSNFLAVLSSSSDVIIYSLDDFGAAMRINLKVSNMNIAEPSLQLTNTNALILVSKKRSNVVVLHLDINTKLYKEICVYKISSDIRLSGNFDWMERDGGTIMALGMQTLDGVDGVLLIGFQGAFAFHHDLGQCLGLGRIISRDNELRVDDGIPRASVSIQGSNIVFGTPGELTWPDRSEDSGTGRVHIMTYCPLNHKRVRISRLVEQQQIKCKACEDGRKSLGGVTTICTVCEGRKCPLPFVDDPFHFVTKVCNDSMCPLNEQVSNVTKGIKVIQNNGTFFEEGAVNEYTVKLVETTRAGTSTTSQSEPFIIDTTSPVVGTVYDGLGSDQNTNCSKNETLGEDSQCSTRSFQDSDIDFTNNTSEVHSWWIDFADNESDIAEYFWCVGSKPILDDIRQCESTGQRQNGSHYGLNFTQGDKYYVTVVACNGAQRCSAAHSNGVTIDVTPPTMQYVRDGVLGPDMDYQVFLDIIFAYFKAADEDSGVSSYEVAWGTAPGLTDMKEYEEIGNTTIWYAKFKDNALEKKKKYFAIVRASNKAGLLSEPMSSDGIIVGKSEYIFDKNTSASFFFDTVNVKTDGTREDGGVGETYGTLDVPEGAVDGEIKIQCYSLDNKALASNKSEDGPVFNPTITKPKQFMLGNYSFQIKALDPFNNTPHEGYQFAKPIKISMFYDVDTLVKANKRVVNNEVKKEDIDPVLYLWDLKNSTWIDASHTCPEPWYHINRTIKLLTVQVCHLTQFAFFWSFKAQNGLMMFDKNISVYNATGYVSLSLEARVKQIDLLVKRSKGASGSIVVYWSLYSNKSIDDLIWPKSGKLRLIESQWNATLSLNLSNDKDREAKQVISVRLDNVTGGAILASRDETETNIIVASSSKLSPKPRDPPPSHSAWIVVGTVLAVIIIFIVIVCSVSCIRSRKRRGRAEITNSTEQNARECLGSPASEEEQTDIDVNKDLTSEISASGDSDGMEGLELQDMHGTAVTVNGAKESVSKEDNQAFTVKPRNQVGYSNPGFEDVDVTRLDIELNSHKDENPEKSFRPSESSDVASSDTYNVKPTASKDVTVLAPADGEWGASNDNRKETKTEGQVYNNPIYQAETDDD